MEQGFENLPKDIDSDLIGGFLTALISFSQEIADETLQKIDLETFSIHYNISDLYIIAAACSKSMNHSILNAKLEKISFKFSSRYGDILKNFSGNVEVFQEFSKEIENIVEQPTISLRYITQTKEQFKTYVTNKMAEFDQFRGYLDNYIGQKAEDFKNLVEDTFKNLKSKIKKSFKKK